MGYAGPPSLLAFPHDSTVTHRCKRSRANEAKDYVMAFGVTSLEGLRLGMCVDRRVNLKAINDGGPESVAYAGGYRDRSTVDRRPRNLARPGHPVRHSRLTN